MTSTLLLFTIMKNSILPLLALCLLFSLAEAQPVIRNNDWELGVTASIFNNRPTIKVVESSDPNITRLYLGGVEKRLSYSGGVFLKFRHTKRILSMVELQYAVMNQQYRRRTLDGMRDSILVGIDSYRYAQLNPMIGYRVYKGLSLYAGPSLNLLMEGTGQSRELVTGRWTRGKSFLNRQTGRNFAANESRFLIGWQAKAVYSYNRLSAHVTYFRTEQRMGRWHPVGPTPTYSDFYFSSWQFGLAYSIIK